MAAWRCSEAFSFSNEAGQSRVTNISGKPVIPNRGHRKSKTNTNRMLKKHTKGKWKQIASNKKKKKVRIKYIYTKSEWKKIESKIWIECKVRKQAILHID